MRKEMNGTLTMYTIGACIESDTLANTSSWTWKETTYDMVCYGTQFNLDISMWSAHACGTGLLMSSVA